MEEEQMLDQQKRVKPALKKNLSGKVPAPSKKPKKGLKWDEEAIAEHDQLRGTRMKVSWGASSNTPSAPTNPNLVYVVFLKIEEPNTPYHYDSGAESDGSHPRSPAREKPTLNINLLNDKLTEHAAMCPSSPSSHASTEDDRKNAFREHRKQHYNEMELVKKFRQENPDVDGDDDEDNDADDEN